MRPPVVCALAAPALTWALGACGDDEEPPAESDEAALAEFQEEFTSKWRERTVCSEDVLSDVAEVSSVEESFAEWCSNIEAPSG